MAQEIQCSRSYATQLAEASRISNLQNQTLLSTKQMNESSRSAKFRRFTPCREHHETMVKYDMQHLLGQKQLHLWILETSRY